LGDPTRGRDIEATTATARLPGLDIEIVHRRSPDGDAEQISINLQAVPSFEAFGRFIESANPFAFWAQAAQLAWLPWLAATKAVLPADLMSLDWMKTKWTGESSIQAPKRPESA
jgi:hypothetical protein